MPSDPDNESSTEQAVAGAPAARYDPELSAGARHHEAGRFREAEQLYRRVLQRDPNNAEALNLLGVLAAQAGHARDAKDLLAKAVAIDGGNPEFHYNLGLVYQGTGDRDEAIKSYRQAVGIKPDYGDAWLNLGGLLLNKGDAQEAELCSRHAVRIDPANPVAHHNLGAALLVRQAHREAEQCFREALRLKPDYAEALNGLGVAESARGALHDATASFRRALALKPDYAEAHNSLGYALFEQDRLEEAIAEVQKAQAAKPELVQARVNHAIILVEQEKLQDAIRLYDDVLRNQPANPAALAGKAGVLDRQGRRDEAAKIVLPFADTGSLPHAMIPLYGKLSRDVGRHEQAISLLEGIERSGTAAANARRALHFALGDLLDDLGHYDRAFGHFAAGNALRPTDHDPERVAARTDRIIAFFSAERLARLPRAEERPELPSDLPVFIVGTPRSGTSLVEQILSCHPRVHAAGESREMLRVAEDLGLRFQDAEPEASDAMLKGDRLTAASERYLRGLRARADGAARVTDKMPYNFERLGLISLLFPRARVIHCRRDPLDSCLSCYFQNFARGNFQTFDLRHLGLFYRQYERLMAHWREVLDLPVLDVSYEAHVDDPEGTCRQILAFLGLDWDPACLEFHQSTRYVKTASRDQVSKPIYRSSVGRWRNYETHLGPLKEALGLER
ncbi:MAG TPA: sulfotransferase [Kiloniellales bacterium]